MRGTTNKEAWLTYLEAEKLFSINSKKKMQEARRKFAESITLDPNFARGHGYLSYVLTRSVQLGWLPENSMEAAERHARQAVKLDPNDYTVFWDLGFCLLGQGKLKPAFKAIRQGARPLRKLHGYARPQAWFACRDRRGLYL